MRRPRRAHPAARPRTPSRPGHAPRLYTLSNGSKAISLRSQDIRYDTHPRADSQDRAVQRQSRILGGRLGIDALRPLAELVRILPRYRHTITFYESDSMSRTPPPESRRFRR